MSDQAKSGKPGLVLAYEIVAIVLGGIGTLMGLLGLGVLFSLLSGLGSMGVNVIELLKNLLLPLLSLALQVAILLGGIFLLMKNKLGSLLVTIYIYGTVAVAALNLIFGILSMGSLAGTGFGGVGISALLISLILSLLGPAFFFIMQTIPATKDQLKAYYDANLK